MTNSAIIACPQCDLIYRTPEVPEGGAARCYRCDAVLFRRTSNSIERTLAMAVTALILFVVANAFPFLTFELGSDFTETTLLSGVAELWRQEMHLVAALVLTTTVVGPLLHLLVLVYLLAPLQIGRRAWGAGIVFRWFRRIVPWSMLEVFLLGVLVSIVRLADMAEIIPGIALWSFGLLIPTIAATTVTLDQHALWERLGTPSSPAEVSQ